MENTIDNTLGSSSFNATMKRKVRAEAAVQWTRDNTLSIVLSGMNMFSKTIDVIIEEIVPNRKYQKARIMLFTSFKAVPEITIFSVVPHTAQQNRSVIDINTLYIDDSFSFSLFSLFLVSR